MLSDFTDLVNQVVRDDAGLISPEDIRTALVLAVNRYSLDRGREIVEDLPPNGASSLPLPSLWEAEFSQLHQIEYPFGEWPPKCLDNDTFGIYQTPTGAVLRLSVPPTSEVRVMYTIAHVLTETEDTIPAKHREAVCCWAAAFCYDQLAAFYAGATDRMLQADNVQRGTQSGDYAKRAATLRKRYQLELGLEDLKAAPAGTTVDWNMKASHGGDRFSHGT